MVRGLCPLSWTPCEWALWDGALCVYFLSFRTILAAAVTLLLASPQPGTAFLFPGMLCPHADVPIRRKSHQSSPPPPPPYLAWGQRDPVLDYAWSIYTIPHVYGRKEFWLENILLSAIIALLLKEMAEFVKLNVQKKYNRVWKKSMFKH